MKHLLLSILFLSSLYSAISDFKSDDYQVLIGKEFDDEAFDIIEDYDMNISVIGYTQEFKTEVKPGQSYDNAFDYLSSQNANYGEQLRLIKLDQSARTVNDIHFKLSELNRGTNILKTAENGYLLGGFTHNGEMIISSLNEKGKQYYLKKFGTANFDRLHSLVGFEDGSSIAIGTSQTSRNSNDDIFVQGLGSSDVYLVKFTREGEISWKKKYGTTGRDIGIDAVATGDGGFIVISLSYDANGSTLNAAKFNDTGDTVWTKSFPKAGHQNGHKIIRTDEGRYLISASFENKNAQKNIRLIAIDDEGSTISEKSLYADADEQLNDICMDLKGNIVGVGYSKEPSSSDMDALVRYFDHNGNMIWERKFGKKRQDAFKSVALLHDNSFAVAGFSNSFADKGHQIWVVKINDDGSLAKKQSTNYLGLYEALLGEFSSSPEIHIYKDLHITHEGLIFKQGSSTLTQEHKSTLKSFMPRLIEILSHYKSNIKNLHINGYTSTEWNAPDTERYLKNAYLSNERAMHLLEYSYQLKNMHKHHEWINEILSTDGHSFSNLIYADEKENRVRSRRVEFEVILK